jgi:phenylalanyl-tRNA synthetase beta chain
LAPAKATFEVAEHPSMHPGRCARVMLGGVELGFVGEIHPRWRLGYDLSQAPIMFELELAPILQRSIPAFKAVARHQAVERDIAILVAEAVTHSDVMSAVWSAPTGGVLRDATLFDIYRPKAALDTAESGAVGSAKSLAVRLTLNSAEATLTEEQIEIVVAAVVDALVTGVAARQRA